MWDFVTRDFVVVPEDDCESVVSVVDDERETREDDFDFVKEIDSVVERLADTDDVADFDEDTETDAVIEEPVGESKFDSDDTVKETEYVPLDVPEMENECVSDADPVAVSESVEDIDGDNVVVYDNDTVRELLSVIVEGVTDTAETVRVVETEMVTPLREALDVSEAVPVAVARLREKDDVRDCVRELLCETVVVIRVRELDLVFPAPWWPARSTTRRNRAVEQGDA